MHVSCETCPVKDSAACAVLSADDRNDLAAAGHTRSFARGEVLFAAGDEDIFCATLVSGALKVANYDRDGNERILALIHPSGFIGELFAPFATFDVVALTESKLCIFSQTDMRGAIERYPQLAQALLRRSEEDVHRAHKLLSLGGKTSAREKVGSLITSFARAASHSPCAPELEFDLPLSRQEIADMLGISIETVSRTFTQLEKEQVIDRNGARGLKLLKPALLGSTY